MKHGNHSGQKVAYDSGSDEADHFPKITGKVIIAMETGTKFRGQAGLLTELGTT